MGENRTIKELVIETCMHEGMFPSYEKLTSLVLKQFPTSKWKKTHYAWYKSKIKNGEIQIPGFLSETQTNNTDDEIEEEVQQSIDASLSFEKDLHSYFAARVSEIEPGLTLVEDGVEFQTDAGRIDLLARDEKSRFVVIELKVRKATDSALGQLLGYMGCLSASSEISTDVRGILVAFDFEQRVMYAARELPSIKLIKYKLSFELHEIS